MIGKLFGWLDHRTGYKRFLEVMLLEHIPGGAKWRYVWGSALAFVFMIQVVTGLLLMTAYSPGDSTAWGSVYFIQYEMDFGWLIRGLHHFGSQAMVVLLGLHMLQVVIAGAHLPPREINWWLGLMLMGIVLGLSLTGYLLPWDQKGYWATRVATNIASNIPWIGADLQKIIVGGPDYGNATLTRFYALHVGILPASLVVLLVLHVAVFRRHGITAPANAKGSDFFWPAQAFRDMVVCMIIFGIMLALVIFGEHGNKIEAPHGEEVKEVEVYAVWEDGWYDAMAQGGKAGRGANLDAPADPDTQGYPARPEWYFLFLFQLLKYFEGDKILIGTVFIPNGVMLALFLLPLFGYGRMRKFGHFLGILAVVGVISSAGVLTALAMADDSPEPILFGLLGHEPVLNAKGEMDMDDPEAKAINEKIKKAQGFQKAVKEAEKEAQRAVQLASERIPEEGGRELLRKDPLTRGSKLFEMNCALCHKYTVRPGELDHPGFTKGPFKASDLGEFGSEKWTLGLLKDPGHVNYFGALKDGNGKPELTTMIKWRENIDAARKDDPKIIEEQDRQLASIAKWLAQQKVDKSERNLEWEKEGTKAFFKKGVGKCASCHDAEGYFESKDKKKSGQWTWEIDGGGDGPSLVKYGSAEWIRFMVMSPAHRTRYGAKLTSNFMPAFRPNEGPGAEVLMEEFRDKYTVPVNPLSDIDRELIIRWMTRDYRVVFGGQVISAAPKK